MTRLPTNAQIAVDATAQILVSQAVTNQPPDPEQLPAVVEGLGQILGEDPEKLSGDNGYHSETNITYLESRDIDPYLATGRRKHRGCGSEFERLAGEAVARVDGQRWNRSAHAYSCYRCRTRL